MSLMSRIKRVEEDLRKRSQPILCSYTQEESERKLKKYWAENPDGPAPIVITATMIDKRGRVTT